MQKTGQFIRVLPASITCRVKLGKRVHSGDVESGRPAPPILCRVVYVPPTALLPIKGADEPLHFVVRQMDCHIKLKQKHVVGASMVGVPDEIVQGCPVRRKVVGRSLNEAFTYRLQVIIPC